MSLNRLPGSKFYGFILSNSRRTSSSNQEGKNLISLFRMSISSALQMVGFLQNPQVCDKFDPVSGCGGSGQKEPLHPPGEVLVPNLATSGVWPWGDYSRHQPWMHECDNQPVWVCGDPRSPQVWCLFALQQNGRGLQRLPAQAHPPRMLPPRPSCPTHTWAFPPSSFQTRHMAKDVAPQSPYKQVLAGMGRCPALLLQ